MNKTNEYGMTAQEWLLAAAVDTLSWQEQTRRAKEFRDAWLRGEDPSDYRFEHTNKQERT